MSHECIKPSGTFPQHINKVETMRMGQLTLKDRNLPNPLANKNTNSNSSSFVSFTHFSPTCGRMPLPALSLWPGRQPYRPRLVGDRRGGGPSSVAPRSRNPPTERRQDSPISSSLFSHPCAPSVKGSPTEPVLSRSSRQRFGHLQSHFDDGGWNVCQARLSFQSRSLLLLADESSGVTVRMKFFRNFNLLALSSSWLVMEQLVSGICRLSSAFHVAGNSPPDVRRSDTGQ